MPLTSLRVRDFKCFHDSSHVPLKPLTVVFGRNNTGKSSLLQSLLLLQQSMAPSDQPRLNLRGPNYAAGSYTDVVHQHRSRQDIQFSLSLSNPRRSIDGQVEFEFCADEPQPPRLVRVTVTARRHPRVEVRRGVGRGGPYELMIGETTYRKPYSFTFGPSGIIPSLYQLPHPPNRTAPRALRAARYVLQYLQFLILSMHSIDAFRTRPSRRYEYFGETENDFASHGDSAVNAIIADSLRRSNRGLLMRAANTWLKHIGRVRLMTLRKLSKSARIYELTLKDTDSRRWANYADVGFGIGQVLPVIIEGLQTPEGGVFLVQEPEINLHPDAQLAMADFLLALVYSGRQVIVETHSENLLLRIRRRVAESHGKRRRPLLNRDSVSILYVDKVPSGQSRVQSIQMDALGQLKTWPKGFMEETTKERVDIIDKIAASMSNKR